MKIAFTSCCNSWNDPIQPAWLYLAKHNPEVLVLLGENVHMNYRFEKNSHDSDESNTLFPPVFAKKMYENYAKQWAIPSFQKVIQQIPTIHAIWNDHDFAWNNRHGEAAVCTCVKADKCKCKYVTSIYRKISKTLFEQFRTALATKPSATSYPLNPYQYGIPAGLTDLPYTGIEKTLNLSNNVHLHLLDGRSYKPDANINHSMLGYKQQTALAAVLNNPDAIHLITSRTSLKDWEKYNDYAWLKTQSKNSKIIVLSGDIHRSNIRKHHDDRVFEFITSTAAQSTKIIGITGEKSNIFGILDIKEEEIKVNIWKNKKLRESATLNHKNWCMTYQLGSFGKFLAHFK